MLFSSSIGRPSQRINRIVPSSEIKRIGGLNKGLAMNHSPDHLNKG